MPYALCFLAILEHRHAVNLKITEVKLNEYTSYLLLEDKSVSTAPACCS